MRKKIYITGICGMLGNQIAKELHDKYEIRGGDLADCDIDGCQVECYDLLDFSMLKKHLKAFQPDVVVHTAAAVNVDQCETDRIYAYNLNVGLTKNLAEICDEEDIKLIYISTDAVFDGEKAGLYNETDIVNPINYYGETKLIGEQLVEKYKQNLILRTNIYGTNIQKKNSFGEWILQSLEQNQELGMFFDIQFSPILVNELAWIIYACIEKNVTGLFHACGTGSISKYEFGMELKKIFQLKSGSIKKISSDTFDFKAPRAKNMGMDNSKIKSVLDIKISTPVESIYKFKSLLCEGR